MKRKGFTIAELIIVIAVIGILAAILIPVFSNVVLKANEKSALSDARNIVEEYILEDQIRDNENRARLPENICILVYKGNRFYAYGYNTKVGGSIQVSAANPMEAEDYVDCINKFSWNNSEAHFGEAYDPTVDQATLDSYTIENDGAFYLVPYEGTTPQNDKVRGIPTRETATEVETYRLINNDAVNEMEFDYGEQTGIFHGCLVGSSVEAEPETAVQTTYTVKYFKGSISVPVMFANNTEFTDGMEAQGGTGYTLKGALKATGYTFAGWYYRNTALAGTQAVSPVDITEYTEFEAHWVQDTCTIVLEENGGSFMIKPAEFGAGLEWADAPTSTNIHTVISGLTVSAPAGKTQQGWQINLGSGYSTYNSGSTYSLPKNGTVIIRPVFDTNSYLIHFNTNGGTPETIEDVPVEHGGTLYFPPAPTKANFDFFGWQRTDITTDPYYYKGTTYPYPVEGEMTFTAQWGNNTVTYYQPDGTTQINITSHTGNVWDVPTVGSGSDQVHIDAGYVFDGWTVSPAGAGTFNGAGTQFTATANATLTAKQTASAYTVTFKNSLDESTYSGLGYQSSVNHGDTVTQPAAAPSAPSGYTFARWSLTKNGTTPYDFSTPVTGNITIWAVWDSAIATQACTITFKDGWNDQTISGTTSVTLPVGEEITDALITANGGSVPQYFTNDANVLMLYYGDNPVVASGTVNYTIWGELHKEINSEDYIVVKTAAGLAHIGGMEGGTLYPDAAQYTLAYNYQMANDITVSSSTLKYPIGWSDTNGDTGDATGMYGFGGTFDGNGYTISGVSLDYDDYPSSDDYNAVGLFAGNTGTVKNFKLNNPVVSGNMFVGGVVGVNQGTVSNVIVSLGANAVHSVSGHCGGAVGFNDDNAVIEDVRVYSTAYQTISGKTRPTAKNIWTGESGQGYGVAWRFDGSGDSNYYEGVYAGGVAGTNAVGSVIRRCSAGGTYGISISTYTFLYSSQHGYFLGGISGANAGTIDQCWTYNAYFNYALSAIHDTYGSAQYMGAQFTGGIAGLNIMSGTISNVWSNGSFHITYDFAAGLVAQNNGTVRNAWACLSGVADSANGGEYYDDVAANQGTMNNIYVLWLNLNCQSGSNTSYNSMTAMNGQLPSGLNNGYWEANSSLPAQLKNRPLVLTYASDSLS